MGGCIFCGTKDNVSTSMRVKTAKGETTVPICVTHEDEASPKKVRELVEAREIKIAEMSAILEPMGFKIVPITGVGAVAVPPPSRPAPAMAADPAPASAPAPGRPRKVNSAANIKAPSGEFSQAAEGYDTSDAPALIESEVQEVKGVGGAPVFIPKKLVTEAGVTDIRVVTAMNDADIQKRFKGVADGDTKFKVKDYGLKDCTFCSGTGKPKIVVPGGSNLCPRCKGVGQS